MDQDIISLLKKYVVNRCTPRELERVEDILASGNYIQEWNTVLEEEAIKDMADDSTVNDFDSEAVLSRINYSIGPIRKLNTTIWALGIAASLFVMLSVGYIFWKSQPQTIASQPLLSLVTAPGQQKKITLEDGTEITLNCGTKLRYTAAFSGAKREVYLNGEAFFNVAHDVKHPFIVHTNQLNVQVLGTSFNIKSYKNDNRATVSVATGKVGVYGVKPTRTYMLLPGNRLSYNQKGEFKQDNISFDDIVGWQKGILIFRLETIREIAPVLERYYGITVHIGNSKIPEKQVTASFDYKPLTQVLEILSQTAGFRYTIIKNEVHIN